MSFPGGIKNTAPVRRPVTQRARTSIHPELREYRLELTVLDGANEGLRVESKVPNISIGAGPTCDLQLDDRWASKVHCTISVRDGLYILRDAGSRNGTLINGLRIFEAAIRPGTVIEVGGTRVHFSSTESRDALEISPRTRFGELLAASDSMRAAFALMERVSGSELTCMVQGETGTGKELCARAIHEHSRRANERFVVIDCAAISENLIEDKLFGHERGAFTGAQGSAAGAFEEAHGGTVFLDEIGELPLRLQPKLLGVLERREIVRLGSHKARPVNVRLVAATHRDLKRMVEEGTFRSDLFFRLSEAVIALPPLRERPEDIDLLVHEILERDCDSPVSFSTEAVLYLCTQPWPGNVRELRNLVRRAVALSRSGIIDSGLLASLHEPMTLTTGGPPLFEGEATMGVDPPCARPSGDKLVGLELPLAAATDAYRAAYVRELAARYGDDHEELAEHLDVNLKYARRLLKRYRNDA